MDIITIIVCLSVSILVGGVTLAVWLVKNAAAPKSRPQPVGDLPPLDPRAGEGLAWKSAFRPRGKNTPASVTVKVEFPFPAPVAFKTESALDRFGKSIGLAGEVQTGDAAFDDAIYVDSPYPDYAAAMLSDSDNRRAIRRCFAAAPQLARISCTPAGSEFHFCPAEKNQVPAAIVEEVLAALPPLRRTVSRMELRRSWFREKAGAAVIGATVFFGVLGFLALALGLGLFEVLDGGIFLPGLLGGLAAGVLFAALAFLVLRGRSGALVPFALALFLGLFDFSLGGIGAIHLANGLLDRSEAQTHVVTVTGLHVSRGKNSTSYHVSFNPWRPGQIDELSVGYDLYARLETGSQLTITSSAGGLGYERLVSYE